MSARRRATGAALMVINARTGLPLATRACVTRGVWERLRGLLARPPIRAGEGLLIRPCNGIHTAGMGFPIDALFLDAEGRVLRAVHALAPWRCVPWVPRARCVLELPAGTIARSGTDEHDRLAMWETP